MSESALVAIVVSVISGLAPTIAIIVSGFFQLRLSRKTNTISESTNSITRSTHAIVNSQRSDMVDQIEDLKRQVAELKQTIVLLGLQSKT